MTGTERDDGLDARRAWAEQRKTMRRHHSEAWEAEYRARLGERVTQPLTPSMAVTVNTFDYGRRTVAIHAADATCPRIDTVCQDDDRVIVINGVPAASPVPPRIPMGVEAIAHVRVGACVTSIVAANIEGAL